MNEATPAQDQQIPIPPVPVNLPLPVVDVILRALGKLEHDEVAETVKSLKAVKEDHIRACVARFQAAQAEAKKAAAKPAAPSGAKLKPTAAAAKAVTKATRKR